MAAISLEQVSKLYPGGLQALTDVDLEVGEGEFVVLVGPSGCGKTTLLRIVAGLEEITNGTLRIGERVANDLPPKHRDVAMVFQSYALYPHMTVAENIGFSLKVRHLPRSERDRRVREAAAILGLADLLDRKPRELSGGQRQRVAMGRAIVREPGLFLMDEPLSNLDASLRGEMRAEVSRIQRRLGVATLYVTHDQTEAITMGDRVAVLRGGVVQQCDAPMTIYDQPSNLFVAAFIGSPAMNLYEAELSADGAELRLGKHALPVAPAGRPSLQQYAGSPVVVGIRPEYFELATDGPPTTLDVSATLVEALGSELLVRFSLDARRVHPEHTASEQPTALESAGEGIAKLDRSTHVRTGDIIPLAVDLARLSFFDPASGAAI